MGGGGTGLKLRNRKKKKKKSRQIEDWNIGQPKELEFVLAAYAESIGSSREIKKQNENGDEDK